MKTKTFQFIVWALFATAGNSAAQQTLDDNAPVVVIGAGMAGISAAQRLNSAGISVRIVEARDRIGGRIYPLRDGSNWLELGSDYIYGTCEANPVFNLANKYDWMLSSMMH